MLASGSIDMALVSTIILALYLDPRFDVFSLPWLFPDHDVASAVCDGPAGREALHYLEEKGIRGLAYGANGFRQLTNSVRPVRAPEDLEGLRCRVAGSRLFFRIFERLGANALTMNFGEVFTSLQQGVIDGQENPLSIIYSSRLHEVQPYLTLWNYSYDPLILAINQSRWERFSPGDQTLLMKCAKEAMAYQRKIVREEDRVLPDLLEEKGMRIVLLGAEEIEVFQNRVKPLYGEFAPRIGPALIARFVEAIEAAGQQRGP